MARFCTECGARNEDAAAFCEACGKALAGPVESPAGSVPAPGSSRSRLVWWLAGVGFMLTAMALAMVVWLARPQEADPRADIGEALRLALATRAELGESHVCMTNLPYQLDELRVRPADQATNDWLAVLVGAGYYQSPRVDTVEREGVLEDQRVYLRTEQGARMLRNGRLCFADGIDVVRVEAVTPPRLLKNGQASSVASFVFRYRHAQPWTRNPRLRDLMPARFAQESWPAGAAMARGENGWRVERLLDASMAEQAIKLAQASADKEGAKAGWWGWARKLFGAAAPDNPLLGSWRADLGGLGNLAGMMGVLGGVSGQEKMLMTLDFAAGRMRIMGEEVPVAYEIRADEVIVRVEKGGAGLPGGDVLAFKLRDRDHISLDLAVVEIPYVRIK